MGRWEPLTNLQTEVAESKPSGSRYNRTMQTPDDHPYDKLIELSYNFKEKLYLLCKTQVCKLVFSLFIMTNRWILMQVIEFEPTKLRPTGLASFLKEQIRWS